MLEVKGFRGLRFNVEKVGSLDLAVTPPYDVISPAERDQLAAQSPYNMTHVILPVERDGLTKYQVAGQTMDQWLEMQVLTRDTEESLYLLEQTFTGLDGAQKIRRGFLAAVKLPEPGESLVLGHERTFDKPFEDRLLLTEATRSNMGPVFVLYADPDKRLTPFLDTMNSRPAEATAHTIDGVTQRLWAVPHSDAITEFFESQRLYIADGHHRFRTACVYRDRMREKENPQGLRPYDYVLMGFVPFEDPGLAIYPPHRVLPLPEAFEPEAFLAALSKWFEVVPAEDDLAEQVKSDPAACAMGVVIRGKGRFLLRLRAEVDREAFLGSDRGPAWRDLDVAILHRGIIENILGLAEGTQFVYERNADTATALVEEGDQGLAFLLRATRPEQVRACAEACEPMPQKSTYFFPKLPTGMVIHRLA